MILVAFSLLSIVLFAIFSVLILTGIKIVLTPTQQNLFFDQRHIDQFLQFFLQHRFIRQL